MLFLGPFRLSQARSGAGHAVSVWDGPMRGIHVEGASLSLLFPAELGRGWRMALPGGPSQIHDGSTGHLRRGVLWRAGRLQLRGVFGKLVPWWGEAGRDRAVRAEAPQTSRPGGRLGAVNGGRPSHVAWLPPLPVVSVPSRAGKGSRRRGPSWDEE